MRISRLLSESIGFTVPFPEWRWSFLYRILIWPTESELILNIDNSNTLSHPFDSQVLNDVPCVLGRSAIYQRISGNNRCNEILIQSYLHKDPFQLLKWLKVVSIHDFTTWIHSREHFEYFTMLLVPTRVMVKHL